MKLYICLLLLSIPLLGFNQTLSRLIDPIDGETPDLETNNFKGLEIIGSNIFLNALHICDPDTSDNLRVSCTSITKVNMNGTLINSILLDTIFPYGHNRIAAFNDKIILTGNSNLVNSLAGVDTEIFEFDQSLNLTNQNNTTSQPNEEPFNEGITFINGNWYMYGLVQIDDFKSYSHIQKLDSNYNLIWDRKFARAKLQNRCFDLQATADGNLIYIHEFFDQFGAGGEQGVQIMLMDTTGNKIDSLEYYGESLQHPRMLASKEGPIYFTTKNSLEPSTFQSFGRINKYSADLDSLLWSIELPFNTFNARRYNIYDYMQAENGDILACGRVWEAGPDGPQENTQDMTWNGFVVRVSQSGEILWIHIYRLPNEDPILPEDEFGKFRPSSLWQMQELEDGRIVVGGSVGYTTPQVNVIGNMGGRLSELWLMIIEGEDGCIEGEECQEVIALDGEVEYTYTGDILSEENEWTEVSIGMMGNKNSSKYTWEEDSTWVNLNWYTELLQSAEEEGENWNETGKYFREAGSKIYQLHDGEGEYSEKCVKL